MGTYRFTTTWQIDKEPERVWEALRDVESYPRWWPGFEDVEVLDPGGPDGQGLHARFTTRSRLPYRLRFETIGRRLRRPELIIVDAAGELAGSGRWDLRSNSGGATVATYQWDVETSKRWMLVLEPFLAPLFVWNHHVLMTWGGHGLARFLGGQLVEVEHSPTLRTRDWLPLTGLAIGVIALAVRFRGRPG